MLGSFQESSGALPVWGFQRGVSGPALRSACLGCVAKDCSWEECYSLRCPEWVMWALGFEGCPGVHPSGKRWGGPFRINGQSVCSRDGGWWATVGQAFLQSPACHLGCCLNAIIMGL